MLTIFYILGALVLGLWYWLVSREDNGLAFLSVFAGLGALELYGYPVLDSIISNSKYVLLWAGVYFLIGFIWSIPKWYLWSKKQFAIYEKERKDWEKHHPDEKWVGSGSEVHYRRYLPHLNRSKTRITGWILHWPMSILVTLLSDWLSDLATSVVEVSKKFYQKLARMAAPEGFDKDLLD